MRNYKIRQKYCIDDKVQVMFPKFSNAPSHIIFSKDGYLYLKDEDTTIYQYLQDLKKPIVVKGNSDELPTNLPHLFKYDQIYVKFAEHTKIRKSGFGCCEGGYTLTFLYVTKKTRGEAIFSEWVIFDGEDFYQRPIRITKFMKKSKLEEFLYGTSGLIGKYIFNFNEGIKYAKSINEDYVIKKDYIDLSDESIIKLYNISKHPLPIFESVSKDQQNQATTIDEVKEFGITGNGFNDPVMITVTDSQVNLYVFRITYCSKYYFRVDLEKIAVKKPKIFDICSSKFEAEYLPEPEDL